MKRKVKPIKKKVIKTREDLHYLVQISGEYIHCIAKDKNGKLITPYLWTYGSNVMEDVVTEVRIYKDKEIGKYYDMTKIAGIYADIDAYPVFKDWIEFPITDVYLYTEETTDLLNHYKMLGMWNFIK